MNCRIVILFIIFWNQVAGTSFDVRVVVPKNVASGSSATLYCEFTYDTKMIYSVKWYRGNREFFRVMPRDQPPVKTFEFPKLHVDITASNMTQVTLKNVSPILSGLLTCEVTAFPSWTTVSGSETLYVYDPVYLRKPIIKTEEHILDTKSKSLNILCGFGVRQDIVVAVEKIPFVFYVNNEKIDPTSTAVYDDYRGFLILNVNLLRWKDRSVKKITCSANLPGTSGLLSDEIHLTFDSNGSKMLNADQTKFWIVAIFIFIHEILLSEQTTFT